MELPLEEKEKPYVQLICDLFRYKYNGRDKATKKEEIIFHLRATGADRIDERTLRSVIAHIRNNDLMDPAFIVSNVSAGYWLSTDTEELSRFIDQELNRMSNQFSNIRLLHQRIRHGNKKQSTSQQELF